MTVSAELRDANRYVAWGVARRGRLFLLGSAVKDVEDDALLSGELVALLVAGAEWAVGLILTGRRHGVSLEKH
jgi:hypothetical protein